jgi:hypothetical protein
MNLSGLRIKPVIQEFLKISAFWEASERGETLDMAMGSHKNWFTVTDVLGFFAVEQAHKQPQTPVQIYVELA